MKLLRVLVVLALLIAVPAAVVGWQRVEQLRSENEMLRAELQRLNQQTTVAAEAQSKQYDQELQRLRTQAQEVFKLRNEVTQLRSAVKQADALRAENQQLRARNEQGQAGPAAAAPTSPASNTQVVQFPREGWTFAGYSTPAAALVSAVWAMKEGKPQVYLDSLSPEEQARMAKAWENKSEDEIAAKHKQDVSQITNVRVMQQKEISPEEVQLTVFIEGPNRMEIVSMKRAGVDWKFGGFFRDRPQ